MKCYLLSGLDEAQKQQLLNAGVSFVEWDGSSLLIEESQRALALQVLNAIGSESAAGYENIFHLKLHFRRKRRANSITVDLATLNEAQEQARRAYIQICSSRINQRILEVKAALTEKKQGLNKLKKQFIELARGNCFGNQIVSPEQRHKLFEGQFNRLCKLNKLRDIRVAPGAILLYTDILYATAYDTGCRHEIGKFMIYVGLTEGLVLWFNGTRRVDAACPGMNAPYVYTDGLPCISELNATMLELAARCEIATLAKLAIQFVETVNDDLFGQHLNKWPLAAPNP